MGSWGKLLLTEKHKHKCPECGFVWAHTAKMKGNEPAHTCPRCDITVWSKYTGDKKAQFVGCAAPVLPKRRRKE